MTVYPGKEEEYEKRHEEIWPEMVRALKNASVSNFSIFLIDTILFGYVEVEDQTKWEDLANQEIVQKWWGYMEPVMETNLDKSPVSRRMREVFHLD